MKFTPLSIPGVMQVDIEPAKDNRGFFARMFCAEEFAAQGLPTAFAQHSISLNHKAGTLRGLHYQHGQLEAKLVRCTRGAVYDVLVDLRPGPAYGQWQAFTLRAEIPQMLYAPAGVAHGYQTLEDETELHYLISARYAPDAAAGIAYDSPALGIAWPLPVGAISARDRALPPFATVRS